MNQQDTLTMSAAPAAPRAFTAARISSCLGRSPQGIRKALEGIRADGRQIVQGREALAWGIGQLPAALRGQLEEAARCQRFASVEALLSAPAKPYEPPLPLSQIAQADIDYACSLREAMAWALANPGSPDLPASECERRGIEAYAAKFGRAISSRYWRRSAEADAGAGWRAWRFLPPGNFPALETLCEDSRAAGRVAASGGVPGNPRLHRCLPESPRAEQNRAEGDLGFGPRKV